MWSMTGKTALALLIVLYLHSNLWFLITVHVRTHIFVLLSYLLQRGKEGLGTRLRQSLFCRMRFDIHSYAKPGTSCYACGGHTLNPDPLSSWKGEGGLGSRLALSKLCHVETFPMYYCEHKRKVKTGEV